jgi:hypothetical protein
MAAILLFIVLPLSILIYALYMVCKEEPEYDDEYMI